jgi:hypothetical protein
MPFFSIMEVIGFFMADLISVLWPSFLKPFKNAGGLNYKPRPTRGGDRVFKKRGARLCLTE